MDPDLENDRQLQQAFYGNQRNLMVGGGFQRVYCKVGGYSVVHFSGLDLLARALATGEVTVILQTFQNNGFASAPARE